MGKNFSESILLTSVIAWFLAQLIKVIVVFFTRKKIDFRRFIGSGGMPSSHSAFVVSLATAVGLKEGFDSSVFAVSVVLALIVMYDAAGVRRAAGQIARKLNLLVESWETKNNKLSGKKLKELLGHSPVEVLAGAILGLVTGIIRHI